MLICRKDWETSLFCCVYITVITIMYDLLQKQLLRQKLDYYTFPLLCPIAPGDKGMKLKEELENVKYIPSSSFNYCESSRINNLNIIVILIVFSSFPQFPLYLLYFDIHNYQYISILQLDYIGGCTNQIAYNTQ